MHTPIGTNGSAWSIGSVVLCLVLTGVLLSPCPDAHASDNVSFLTAKEKYYNGDIPGALKSIRAHIKQNPLDLEAKVWKGFIRLEVARGLRKKDRERSEKMANSESYETWCLWNSAEEPVEVKEEKEVEDDGEDMVAGKKIAAGDNLVTGGTSGNPAVKGVSEGSPKLQSLWYAAMAKAYWLGRRTPISNMQAYTHARTALRMDPANIEALQIKGEMALDGIIDSPNFTVTQAEIDEYAEAAFEAALKTATRSHPEATMRTLYWLALAKCKSYPGTSPTTLRKLLMPADSGSQDSIYVKNCLKLMEQGCAAK